MANTTLFIPTAKVEDGQPSEWLKQRLDEAYDYYSQYRSQIDGIIISGRWSDATTVIEETEASVAKRYLASKELGLPVILEQFAVELGGNFAFSKPLIAEQRPSNVVIFDSAVYAERVKYFTRKIFDPDWSITYRFISDGLSKNERAIQKEPKALAMFRSLFDSLTDGDDESAREILLNHTPFYDRNKIPNERFFDERWPGGFADFINKRPSIDNK